MSNLVKLLGVVIAAGVLAAIVVVVLNRTEHEKPTANDLTAEPVSDHQPGFHDVAPEAGIHFRMSFLPHEQGTVVKTNLYDHGCGVAVGDFDGDGFDDVYFCNQLGKNALYRNRGDGTFDDVTDKAGVGLGDRVCVAATWADYDNSGRQSLFVTSTRGGNVLFKNLGNGTFKDVTKEAGLVYVGHSQTAIFFDYDNDGFLDLFVCNTGDWTNPRGRNDKYYPGVDGLSVIASRAIEHNKLYHNNGNGTFTDVTQKAGLEGKGWSDDVAVFDYDGDGYLDLFVTNMFGASQLYHNTGHGTFTEVTKQVLGKTSWGGMGCKAFDYDNDGKLDLLLVDMHSDMWMPAKLDPAAITRLETQVRLEYAHQKFRYVTGPRMRYDRSAKDVERDLANIFHVHYNDVLFGNTMFHNLGNGTFKEVSGFANMETFWPWGVAAGDFDNDGYQDVYIPAGMGYPWFYWPSSLMMNNHHGSFVDRARAEGMEPPRGGIYQDEQINKTPATRSSRAAAVADFNHNGRLDLMVNNFNGVAYYYKNQFPPKNYVEFRLHGTMCNRDAIGAVVTLYAGKQKLMRQVDGAGGYLSQSSKTLHFGLGDIQHIDRVEIRWPGQKDVQTIEPPAINQRVEITQPRRAL